MQILLHADPNSDRSAAMAEHLRLVVTDALWRFGERVIRVEARLSDRNGRARMRGDDILCLFEALLVGEEPIVVKALAANAHQAIASALRKLKRAVGAAIAKHDPRNLHARNVEPRPVP